MCYCRLHPGWCLCPWAVEKALQALSLVVVVVDKRLQTVATGLPYPFVTGKIKRSGAEPNTPCRLLTVNLLANPNGPVRTKRGLRNLVVCCCFHEKPNTQDGARGDGAGDVVSPRGSRSRAPPGAPAASHVPGSGLDGRSQDGTEVRADRAERWLGFLSWFLAFPSCFSSNR
jgi:hypothetical protein